MWYGELFDKKYVYYFWEPSLFGKKCFVADYIGTLKEYVLDKELGRLKTVFGPKSANTPFASDDNDYVFCYYDPYYEYKVAMIENKNVLFRRKGTEDEWERVAENHDFTESDEIYEFLIADTDPEYKYIMKYENDKEFTKNYGDFYNSDTAWDSGLNAGWMLHKQYLLENDVALACVIGKLKTLCKEKEDSPLRNDIINYINKLEVLSEKFQA